MIENLLPFLTPLIYREAHLQLLLDLVLTCFSFFPYLRASRSRPHTLTACYYCCLSDRAPAAPRVDVFLFLMETQTWVSLGGFFILTTRFSKTSNLLILCEGEQA